MCVCCRYCAGTTPWGNTGDHRDFEPQRHDDGCIEVIGFTVASLVSRSTNLPPPPPTTTTTTSNGTSSDGQCSSCPPGGAAGGRPRREAAPVQGGGAHHLQDGACAGGPAENTSTLCCRSLLPRSHQCVLWVFVLQVDGEPCRLAPSTLRISLRNQANMVQKSKRRTSVPLLNE